VGRRIDKSAARRGEEVFNGVARCATCHKPPLFADVNNGSDPKLPLLHSPGEVGQEPVYASRSATKTGYRTTPLCATCNASAARVALMIRRKSPAAREAAAGPSGGSPRESRGTGRAGAIGSQIASRRKLAIPVYVPSISVAARGPRRPANEKPGEFYGRTLSAYSPGEMKRPLIRGDAAEAMIDDLRFKVVRSNGTDEILARAINLLNARARVGVFCSHPRRSK
jgi:hypothetical protein